jgi:hypothetical protein
VSDAPPFDPTKPFTPAPATPPPFDPSKPFTPAGQSVSAEKTSAGSALWQGLMHGVGNVGTGAARLATLGRSEGLEGAAAQRRQAFEAAPTTRQHPTATAIGETAGEMGAMGPLGAVGRGAASLWEALATGAGVGAAGGAIGGAATAPGGDKFLPSVGRSAALGGAVGAPMAAAGRFMRPSTITEPPAAPASLVNAPETRSWRDAARMLSSADVRLTPPQSHNLGYKERSLQEWPILRGFVRGGVGRSVDDFDRAVASQALSPLGVAVPRSIPAGHGLMDFGADQFNRAYGQVLPHVSLAQQPTVGALQAHPDLANVIGRMSTDDANSLMSRLQSDLLGRFQNGTMDGQAFKLAESALSRQADRISGSRPELADALRMTLSVVRDELATQNPTYAPQLQRINHAFSMWARVRDAAERDALGKGRFEPSDLLQVLKGESPSNTAFGRGREPMQAFAEAGNEIIGPSLTSRVPETSKSAARMVGDVVGGAIGTPFYLGAQGAQQMPGVGRALTPGVGFEVGKDRPPRTSIGGP